MYLSRIKKLRNWNQLLHRAKGKKEIIFSFIIWSFKEERFSVEGGRLCQKSEQKGKEKICSYRYRGNIRDG